MDELLLDLFQKLHDTAENRGLIVEDDKEAIFKNLKSKQEVLNVTTIQSILELLKKTLMHARNVLDKAKVFDILAELAKSDEVRDFCVDAGWIAIALDYLENDEQSVVLHALRSIGNICYNNELGRKALLGANGADDISRKLQSLNESYDPTKDNRMDVVTCGCVLNLATDDVELAEDFVNCGAMPHLLGLTQQSIHSNPVLCRMAVSAISELMECPNGKTSFKESGGPAILLQALKEDYRDEELSYLLLETLNPLVMGDDIMKKELVNAGCTEALIHVVDSCKGREDDESSKYRLETASDMIVTILTDDECMARLFQDGNGIVVQECANWLNSRNKHLEISGALALGNFGRSDHNCIKLVEKGVHKDLLNFLPIAKQRPESFKYIQAIFGALKNLALPLPNKPILLNDGCLEACLSQLSSQSSLVLTKVLGTMCALMAAPKNSAVKIVNTKGQLDVLIRLSKSTGYEDVRVEASRILAVVVKHGNSQEISHKMITSGGLSQIVDIVTSPRNVVQNEALIAMTVLATTVKPEFYPKLRETGLTQSLLKLIKEGNLSTQSCYNAMAYLEALSLRDYFARDLQVAGFGRIMEGLIDHTDENIKKRALIMVTRLKAKKLEEE
ncbi:rap1 GTPase-GDP dissociation stimulator 1 isoform X2 [Exaiptasia diaphana]|uniref:Uncharacterized protein n=1 Tax=Exaiptasia diaphana TaxID=2652724 RepID=A0A913WWD1_EXADI|nr:rap1 GTPase-GDP dissociation stimulator 1 isoform X2 [Exaiptasia diaphana]KXJ17374.1 Rap1 GTPase-GDP dissociation stimulator 1 [Exaiptasia diaphana]